MPVTICAVATVRVVAGLGVIETGHNPLKLVPV
jgi:hypothetical protein